MSTENEKSRIDDIASRSLYSAGVNGSRIEYAFEVYSRFIRGHSLLEMGPAEGVMTGPLRGLGLSMSVVEASSRFALELQSRYPDLAVTCSLFETYEPGRTFDNIVLGHVLEHVDDPVAILRRAATWLAPGGRIIAAVPNSRSVHRQAAVLMGSLSFEEELNESDRRHGHRRVYNPETFRREFLAAGLEIRTFGGYWLKPLSNAQIEASWTADMVRAFLALGERYPDIAAEIYVVATPPNRAEGRR